MSSSYDSKTSISGSVLTIQNLDDYLYDTRRDIIPPRPFDEFPKLFKVKLSKETENDIDSKVLGLKSTPELSLYTGLLLASYLEGMKTK